MPSTISTTKIAMSAMLPPLFLKVVKASWPGVSIKSNPGTSRLNLNFSNNGPHSSSNALEGISVVPIACVMPPASLAAMAVDLILSSKVVFPWST